MSEAIDIDDDVFAVLKEYAQPFVDSPNTVLRRLLGIDRFEHPPRATVEKTQEHAPRRAAPGTLLPEREYEVPILRYLEERGGRAPSREVVEAVGEALASRLTELDQEELASGDIRWKKRAAFARLRLVERGELVKQSPRGTWEISERGRERLRAR